ncbi:MAG: hypothetical protein MI922_13560 [Bacteroidales bacterium]|nr:hypothetical protein [Bacteroidales bacterium]
MKPIISISCIAMLCIQLTAQVGVGTTNPSENSAMEIDSENAGLLIPRIKDVGGTKKEEGVLIYDVNKGTFLYCRNNTWHDVSALVAEEPGGTATLRNDYNKLQVTGDVQATRFIGHGTIPVGGIIMWSGTKAEIDNMDDWELCDGSNGRPDLRGRFIVGYDNRTNGYSTHSGSEYHTMENTGGSKSVALSKSQLPTHHHEANGGSATMKIKNTSSGNHHHGIKAQWGGDDSNHSNTTRLASGDKGSHETSFNFNLNSDESGAHGHPNSDFDGIVGNGSTQGLTGSAHENRPPFYVLAFIIRVK